MQHGEALKAKDDGDMQLTLNLPLQPTLGRCLLLLAAISLFSQTAQAQNIDQGKSATQLFADSCAACHHNARGLAKGRFRPTLFMFLQDHYTTSSAAAWELSSYLASVDTPSRSRGAASHSKSGTHRPAARPPAPVPSAQSE